MHTATSQQAWIDGLNRGEGLMLDRVADGGIVERWEPWDQAGTVQPPGLA